MFTTGEIIVAVVLVVIVVLIILFDVLTMDKP